MNTTHKTMKSAQTEPKEELNRVIPCHCSTTTKPDGTDRQGVMCMKHVNELLASERTRLLSVESMKMEESVLMKSATATEIINHDIYVRNALRQSILSEMEKGK